MAPDFNSVDFYSNRDSNIQGFAVTKDALSSVVVFKIVFSPSEPLAPLFIKLYTVLSNA